jgi:hypothetical protein
MMVIMPDKLANTLQRGQLATSQACLIRVMAGIQTPIGSNSVATARATARAVTR